MTAQELVERACALARGDGCVAIADEISEAHLRWASSAPTANGDVRRRTLTVVATVRGARGTAAAALARSGVTRAQLEALVREAEDAARASAPADDAQPLLGANGAPARWDEPPAETSVRALAPLARSLGAAFERARGEGRLLFGYARHAVRSTFVASTSGLRLRHDQPSAHLELTATTRDRGASAWAGAAGEEPAGLDAGALDAQLARRLAWSRRSARCRGGRYEVLLPPAAVADLVLPLYFAASARDACDGASVFAARGGFTRVGERIVHPQLTLRSDPAAPRLRCAPFVVARASDEALSVFDTGLALRETRWIADGTLRALVQTRRSAALSGLPCTPRIDNLILEGAHGAPALDAMIARTERGLLLTSLWYVRVADPARLLLAGSTRDGVYLIERGEIAGAAGDFRFNASPLELLARAAEIGRTERALGREHAVAFPRAAMPALRVPDLELTPAGGAA